MIVLAAVPVAYVAATNALYYVIIHYIIIIFMLYQSSGIMFFLNCFCPKTAISFIIGKMGEGEG